MPRRTGRAAWTSDEMSTVADPGEPVVRPQHIVGRIRKIIAMKTMRKTTTKEDHAALAIERRQQNRRSSYPRIASGLVDPEEFMALPGKLQVVLASKKPRSRFRKGKE